jgi:hypothetical protein
LSNRIFGIKIHYWRPLRVFESTEDFPMFRSSLRFVLTIACVVATTAAAFGQTSSSTSFKPRSEVGGYTGNELRNIYRSDIGQGFTSKSLNAIALQNAQARVGYVGQSSAGMASGGTGISSSAVGPMALNRSKPFSSVSSSPTVSPYLNLFREDLDGGSDFNYQTLVRPQLQQQQFNQQIERQNLELSRRVQSISAQSPYKNPAGSESIYPTGHQTVSGYYSHFYPGMSQPRGR